LFCDQRGSCSGVAISSGFGYAARAAALTAIVGYDVDPYRFVQQLVVFDAVIDVTGVAVKPNECGDRLTLGNEPAVKSSSNLVREKAISERQSSRPRRTYDLCAWLEKASGYWSRAK
jgi:hypothetical protein